jgi:hypothetical protein
MAIAAMMRIIATTIKSSISEKPLCFCIEVFCPVEFTLVVCGEASGTP